MFSFHPIVRPSTCQSLESTKQNSEIDFVIYINYDELLEKKTVMYNNLKLINLYQPKFKPRKKKVNN